MPFAEININSILKDKFINESGFEEEFSDAEQELEIILAIGYFGSNAAVISDETPQPKRMKCRT